MDFNIMLKPLSKVCDIRRLVEFMRIVPNGVQGRYEHIKNLLNLSSTTSITTEETCTLVQKVETLLPRFGDDAKSTNAESVELECEIYMRKGATEIGIVNILPPVKQCCGTLKNAGSKVCTVYRWRFKPVIGMMHELKCCKCKTLYRCSTFKKGNQEFYYNNVLTLEYFMSTCDTVFSTDFLNRVDTEL